MVRTEWRIQKCAPDLKNACGQTFFFRLRGEADRETIEYYFFQSSFRRLQTQGYAAIFTIKMILFKRFPALKSYNGDVYLYTVVHWLHNIKTYAQNQFYRARPGRGEGGWKVRLSLSIGSRKTKGITFAGKVILFEGSTTLSASPQFRTVHVQYWGLQTFYTLFSHPRPPVKEASG